MNNKVNILIVEDEDGISNFMEKMLRSEGYRIHMAKTGAQALMLSSSQTYDLILLDLGLPDMSGLEIIKNVREWSLVPIIVVSARTSEKEKVEALDLGADDYITKPFGTQELLARIRTAYRHSIRIAHVSNNVDYIYRAGELTVDLKRRNVMLGVQSIHLTQMEYKILEVMVKHAGKVMTYDTLLKAVWGPTATTEYQVLRVNMANIRRKIENNPANPRYVFTEVGVGYRLVGED